MCGTHIIECFLYTFFLLFLLSSSSSLIVHAKFSVCVYIMNANGIIYIQYSFTLSSSRLHFGDTIVLLRLFIRFSPKFPFPQYTLYTCIPILLVVGILFHFLEGKFQPPRNLILMCYVLLKKETFFASSSCSCYVLQQIFKR